MGELLIRRYELNDLSQVRQLHDRTPPDGQPYVGQVQNWPAELDDILGNYFAFWVAIEGESIIAMTGLKEVGDDVPAGVRQERDNLVRLDTMRVAIERQRQGIGRALVETAVSFATANGWGAMILETTPQQRGAVALYETTGFWLSGQSQIEFEGRVFDQVWFERSLG